MISFAFYLTVPMDVYCFVVRKADLASQFVLPSKLTKTLIEEVAWKVISLHALIALDSGFLAYFKTANTDDTNLDYPEESSASAFDYEELYAYDELNGNDEIKLGRNINYCRDVVGASINDDTQIWSFYKPLLPSVTLLCVL